MVKDAAKQLRHPEKFDVNMVVLATRAPERSCATPPIRAASENQAPGPLQTAPALAEEAPSKNGTATVPVDRAAIRVSQTPTRLVAGVENSSFSREP